MKNRRKLHEEGEKKEGWRRGEERGEEELGHK